MSWLDELLDCPEHQSHQNREAQKPVRSESRDQSCGQHPKGCQQQNGQGVFSKLPHLQLEAALKKQSGKKDNQDDVGCKPVRPISDQLVIMGSSFQVPV